MTTLNYDFKITNVEALPKHLGYENVVVKVQWVAEYSRDGFKSTGAGVTRFNPDAITSFTPLAEVTERQMADWVVNAEGGESFVKMLAEVHERYIREQEMDAIAQPVVLGFVQPQEPAPSVVLDVAVAQQVV
jgi:hypothetical protein